MSTGKKFTQGIAAVFALVAAGSQFTYTVLPSDMANVRRMGNMLYEEPVGEGLHFKIPLIDTVDPLQVDLRTLHIPPFLANTIDNQQVTVEMNFNYTVPRDKVNHLLYGVGKAGGGEVDANIIRVAMDRAARIIAVQNTTLIPAKREDIQKLITARVFEAVQQEFGIEPHSLQIAQISPSDAFITSNEKAVLAKNIALLEQNNERIRRAQAEQAVLQSEGDAKVAVQEARGASEEAVIIAEANKLKWEKDGQAAAAGTGIGVDVFGDTATYLRYLDVKAQLNWDGVRPDVSVTGGAATVVIPGMKP